MDLKDKIICAHKGFFNKESEETYQENSIEVCKISSTKDYIKVIEVDVRKSKDGILYCYHGSPIEYCTTLKFSKDFFVMKEKYKVSTLKDILNVISEDKAVFLDIKDHTVTREDILNAVAGKKFKEVILGNRSVSFLNRFYDMPSEFVKCINENIFSSFYNLKKLKDKNYKYFELVIPFLISKRFIRKVEDNGMKFIGVPAVVYLSKKVYWKTINKYNLKFVISDFI